MQSNPQTRLEILNDTRALAGGEHKAVANILFKPDDFIEQAMETYAIQEKAILVQQKQYLWDVLNELVNVTHTTDSNIKQFTLAKQALIDHKLIKFTV